MLKIIKKLLQQIINDIDSGNSNVSEQQQKEIITFIQSFNRKELSKLEAADYIGVSRATFDNYIKKGLIPEGEKRRGFKEKIWFIKDLNNFKNNGNRN